MTITSVGKIFLILLAFLAYTAVSYAKQADPNFALVSVKVKDICVQAAKTPISPHDQPNSESLKSFSKCDSVNLYYGFSHPADYVKARLCAYATQDYSTLTMIYANGKGINRNMDLAIHFACKAGFAADEIEGRVMHLVQLRDKHWQGNNFDICDDVTSGYMMGICASRQQQQSQAGRRRQVVALTAVWSNTDKNALLQLQQAAADFFSTRGANEVDLSGTARAALEIEEEDSLQNEFLSSLKNLENGHFPKYSADQIAKVDQRLNKIYKQIEADPDFAVGTIDRQGVRKTQRQWLKYREAWIEFGKIKYPQVNADTWKTWLTEKRISMLQDLIA